MKEFLDIIDTFGTSRAIFTLHVVADKSRIDAILREKYIPSFDDFDPIRRLVAENYDDNFLTSRGTFEIDRDRIVSGAISDMRNKIATFIENNLEMRSPKQSKLYRWAYRNMPRDYTFNGHLILVYKYLMSFCTYDMKTADEPHKKNALAILELMMEKYE